jgi:hypothetical protein
MSHDGEYQWRRLLLLSAWRIWPPTPAPKPSTTWYVRVHTDYLRQDPVHKYLHQSAVARAMAATPSGHPKLQLSLYTLPSICYAWIPYFSLKLVYYQSLNSIGIFPAALSLSHTHVVLLAILLIIIVTFLYTVYRIPVHLAVSCSMHGSILRLWMPWDSFKIWYWYGIDHLI